MTITNRQNTKASRLLTKHDLFEYFYTKNLKPYYVFHKYTADPLVVKKITEYLKKQKSPKFSFLDIGCGDGELTLPIVKQLKNLDPSLNISIYAMEPSKSMMANFKNKVKMDNDILKGCETHFFEIGLTKERRLSNIFKRKKFDFILTVFVLFWIDDWSDALNQMFEVLTPNGKICIISLSRDFAKEYANFRAKLFSIAHQFTGYRQEFAEDMEEILKEKNISWESDVLPFKIQHKELFTNEFNEKFQVEEISEKSKNLIEFMTRFPWDNLLESQKQQIINTISAYNFNQDTICLKILWIYKEGEYGRS